VPNVLFLFAELFPFLIVIGFQKIVSYLLFFQFERDFVVIALVLYQAPLLLFE